jgi:aspartate racemase
VPIGRPIHNTQVHILDAHMRPVPIGTTGDLYIGGAGVADGYLGQPELTAAAFPPDPFSDREDARLFRTNDRARFLNDGSIEFFGRSDSQVKVRGYRVELGEVAHHLSAHPQVRHAIVIVREDQADDVRLVAYMLYEQQSGPGDEELRSYLKQKLPDHMIPAAFVALDSIPMLPNSKANIAALPKPEYTKTLRSALDRTYGDERERVLAEIWEEVLQTSRFGPEDSFFEVGGHSLLVARLGALIEERLGVEISNVELFQFPTVRSMARRLGSLDQPANGVVAEMAKRAAGRNGRRSVARPTAGRR